MLSAFLIALREGVEAALVVGIVLVYLNLTEPAHARRPCGGETLAGYGYSEARLYLYLRRPEYAVFKAGKPLRCALIQLLRAADKSASDEFIG